MVFENKVDLPNAELFPPVVFEYKAPYPNPDLFDADVPDSTRALVDLY